MSLTGREHFYAAWRRLVLDTLSGAPLIDLGTPKPYRKEMSVLDGRAPQPYFCLDVAASSAVDLVADGHELPFRDGSVGAIVCSHVLEHVARPDQVIDEMHRVLRPGGGAYITFLDVYPYHASPPTPAAPAYPDYHRFKRDAIELLLDDWSEVSVVRGGGLGQVAVNFLPQRFGHVAQGVANRVDRWSPTTVTPAYYVGARR
jgi:SAM-dependent methyltransferase